MLRSRDRELAAIERLLNSVRAGRGGGFVLRGEPGVGKSALLTEARSRARDMVVLAATGVETESALGYAGLQTLLGDFVERADTLPRPQARALRVALGREDGDPPDRFLVSLASLTLLSAIAEERPVLCGLDDAHWLDPPSLDVIAFVARRIEAEHVAVLATVRPGEGRALEAAGLAVLDVGGLGPDDAAVILQEQWGSAIAPAVRKALVDAAGGNPLALHELPRVLSAEQLSGRTPLPDPLPLAGELERVFWTGVQRLDPDLQAFALLCAALGEGSLATVSRAAASLGIHASPLELPGFERILRIDGPTFGFRHPLMRSAVYQGASPAEQRAAHRALADALALEIDQSERRAWHRGEAALGPDEDVAAELERTAERTLRRSGYAAAVRALERAADLSPHALDRVRRTVAAADAAFRGGDTGRARALVQRAEQLGLADPRARLRAHYLQGAIESRAGVPADGLAILLADVEEAAMVEPTLALRMLGVAGEAAFQAGDLPAYWSKVELLARLARDSDPAQRLHARLQLALRPEGTIEVPDLRQDLSAAEQLDDPDVLVRIAGLVFGFGEYAAARRLRTKAVATARALGAAGSLAGALRALALDEVMRGRYAWAEACAAEGRALALETGQPNLALQHAAILAEVAGLRGREQEARQLADEVLSEATTRGSHGTAALVRWALGQLSLAWGHPEEAIEHLEALWRLNARPHQATALAVIPDLVEAAVHAGRPQLAREWLARLPRGPGVEFSEARALALRSQALLATDGNADDLYQESLRLHATVERPLQGARTALLYGEYLRRDRRRVEARERLRTALETFEQLGAVPWAERARRELRATGETARKRDPGTFDQLTRQELQVVRVVGQGATNREAAAQLIVSPRTIDHHLRSIFAKLGISSRSELIRMAVAGDLPI
jgi:DNA-binding CsgD family transcriptional regulator/tetratricopeptide (TPR) repeat protein